MGDLTDVPGIRVGHWSDPAARTGCTVVLLGPDGAVVSGEVRGAAPGTREIEALAPERSVEKAHAIVLSGGSAFGLAAADGVMHWLRDAGIGFATGDALVPIVPAAVVYDLGVGSPTAHPGPSEGRAACEAAGIPAGRGAIGAGTGATVGKLAGMAYATDAGIGTASRPLPGGGTIAALAVVNALGDVVDDDGTVLAGAPAGHGMPASIDDLTQTTLAVVATDVALTKVQAFRLAQVAHDGYARAIRPVHTLYDGDTIFAVSTGDEVENPLVLQTIAAEVVADAIRDAVR